jgi:hypothetical protein
MIVFLESRGAALEEHILIQAETPGEVAAAVFDEAEWALADGSAAIFVVSPTDKVIRLGEIVPDITIKAEPDNRFVMWPDPYTSDKNPAILELFDKLQEIAKMIEEGEEASE